MDPAVTTEVQLNQCPPAIVETDSQARVQECSTFYNWHFLSTITSMLNSYVIMLSCYLYLPLLFGLPIYYASQGSAFLQDAENYFSTYQSWLSGTMVNGTTMALHTFESNSTQVITSIVLSPSDSPDSLRKVDQAWNSYLESRLAEWKVLFTLACVFIAISVTTFQIPQAIDDPVTRFFASLAVCRVFAGLIYTPIFSLYFNSKFAKSVHFAFLLSQERSEFCSLWTVLSLPAATIAWAMFFFLFTIMSFFGRTAGEGTVDIPPADLGLVFQGVIIVSILLDIANLFWIWKSLRAFREDCLGRIRSVEMRSHNREPLATPV